MSTTTTVTVHCDRCQQWCNSDTHDMSISGARSSARRLGWRRVRSGDWWLDVCPACAADRMEL